MGRAMRILIACEESGTVTDAFLREIRDRGGCSQVYSCDLLPTSGKHGDRHVQADVLQLLKMDWDMVIAFPPCTHLSVSGARHFDAKRRDGRQDMAVGFFKAFTALDHVPHVAIENPVGIMSTLYRKPDQIIQPWMFGHPETKATCLWLKGLPPLVPTNDVREQMMELPDSERHKVFRMPPSADRGMLRSKTYPGIARAMASQWLGYEDAQAQLDL